MIKNYLRKIVREELKELLAEPGNVDDLLNEPEGGDGDGVVMADMTQAEYEEHKLMEEQGWRGFYTRLHERLYGKD